MRERLIELLEKASLEAGNHIRATTKKVLAEKGRFNSKEDIDRRNIYAIEADYLLDNGVIIPPCKVGDVVYEALPKVGHIRSNKVVGFHLGKFPDVRGHKRKEYLICYSDYSLTHIDIGKLGKTIFLTKEEAEQALKGGVQE